MHNPLPKYAREVVYGSMFGDGGVYRSTKSRHFHYMECHSPNQREYIKWKYAVLFPLGTNGIKESTRFHRIRLKNYTTLKFRTKNHSYFTRLRRYFYVCGKKKINRRLLNKLTDVGLAVWFMDDGHCHKNNNGYPQLNISTCDFSEKENDLIVSYFSEVWGINVRIHNRKKYPVLYFNKPNAVKFIKIIRPYILPCMEYKIRYFHKPGQSEKSVEDIV